MNYLTNNSRFHRLENITLKDLRSFDRSHTAVLIPAGMVEEHGDHLPLGTDNFAVDGLALAASAWMLENDEKLNILMLPQMPYGIDPVDRHRPELFQHAGSVWIGRATFKALFSEVAEHMVRYGFMRVFPIGFHGGPDQSVALDEVCAEMRAKHKGLLMVEPMGYVMAGAEINVSPGIATLLGRPLTPTEEIALKGSIHASMFETSMMLHLNSNLVDPMYKRLRTVEWREIFEMADWPGYVGSGPSYADADVGGAFLRWRGVRCGALMLRAMRGEDITALPRHPKWLKDHSPDMEVSEAPRDAELPASEPAVESKPEIYISSDELNKKLKKGKPAPPADPNATPPSGESQTKPHLARPAQGKQTQS